jgi:V-type H+-transporting ATPase subunit a
MYVWFQVTFNLGAPSVLYRYLILLEYPCLCQLNPDVNPFQRTFVAAIRRISELARQLRYLKSKIDNFEIPLRSVEDARHILQGRSGPQIIDELEVTLKELEARVATMEDTYEDFRKKQLELEELRCVLRETAVFFQQVSRLPCPRSRT